MHNNHSSPYIPIFGCLLQNHRGHALPPVWVFGMVDTNCIPALGYMEVVDKRMLQRYYPLSGITFCQGQ